MEGEPKIELPKQKEEPAEPEVETWEAEGGSVGVQDKGDQETELTKGEGNEVINKKLRIIESLDKRWEDILRENVGRLSEEDRDTIQKGRIKQGRNKLFQDLFGVDFGYWLRLSESYKTYKKGGGVKRGLFKKLLSSIPLEDRQNLKIDISQEGTSNPGIATDNEESVSKEEEKAPIEEQEGGEIKGKIIKKTWLEIVADAKSEFPEEIQQIIDRRLKNELIPRDEYTVFKIAIQDWWEERFGMILFNVNLRTDKSVKKEMEHKKKKLPKKMPEIRQQKEENRRRNLRSEKVNIIGHLHQAIKNLDDGEPVNEFKDEARRVVYYDEESEKYFVENSGERNYLGVGDIVSDYAWGIKYVPDGEMIEPAYRIIAKRILVNEARRDLEVLNDRELVGNGPAANHLPIVIEEKVVAEKGKKRMAKIGSNVGYIAEAAGRELLARVSINNDLDFAVLRSSLVEDFDYKYDFKLRLKKRLRGVKIEDGPEVVGNIHKVGVQFTLTQARNKKMQQIEKGKEAIKKLLGGGLKRLPVDEIILVMMPVYGQMVEIYNHWLELGKPSGGPEQFLSRDLKVKLLQEVTKGLVEIKDEDIERIFPKGE